MAYVDEQAAIAEFIRTKGITRCPTACLVPTQGSVPAADRVALLRHAYEREAVRLERLRQANAVLLPPHDGGAHAPH